MWSPEFFQRKTKQIPPFLVLHSNYKTNANFERLTNLCSFGGILLTTAGILSSTLRKNTKQNNNFAQLVYQTKWNALIFDEGHELKNPKTQKYQSLVTLNCHSRFLLTGMLLFTFYKFISEKYCS